MLIIYHGLSCFELQGKEKTVVTDPYGEGYGLKLPRLQADIITVSHSHADHNNTKGTQGFQKKDSQPFIITGPGEYEFKEVNILGIPTFHDSSEGEERGENTVYSIILDGIKICHLGDLGHILTDEQVETIGEVDILFLPVGGIYTINASKAVEVVNQLEPKIVVPMHYRLPNLILKLDPVEKFLKEIEVKEETVDKFRISRKDLLIDKMKIVVIKC